MSTLEAPNEILAFKKIFSCHGASVGRIAYSHPLRASPAEFLARG